MEFKSPKPIYLQIADRICEEILLGRHPAGERLPSVREYAAEVEVNVNTVVRTYDYLSQQEVIYNKRGLGYFVDTRAEQVIRHLQRHTFFHEQLPELFRTMQTLRIGLEEVVEAYNNSPQPTSQSQPSLGSAAFTKASAD